MDKLPVGGTGACGGGPDRLPDTEALLRVFEAARRLVGHRERAAAMASGRVTPARTLAEAIDRDFLGFDLERAEQDLRTAVIAADPDVAPVRRAVLETAPSEREADPAACPGAGRRRVRRRSPAPR